MMIIRIALVSGALALALAAGGAYAQGLKVGIVNTARLEAESVTAKRGLEALEKEIEPRGQEIKSLQKQIEAERQRFEKERDKLSPEEIKARANAFAAMMRKSDQMVAGLAEYHELRKREIYAKVVEEARIAIKAVGEAGRYDLIVQDAVFARPAVDITGLVLKEMAKRAGASR